MRFILPLGQGDVMRGGKRALRGGGRIEKTGDEEEHAAQARLFEERRGHVVTVAGTFKKSEQRGRARVSPGFARGKAA